MAEVFITGHRNPDLDSLCSALAYADLKNLTDPENTYIPVRCSHMSEDIKTLLPSLEIDPPRYMRNVYPKVSDVMLTSVLDTNADQSLSECARLITERTPSAFPIFLRPVAYPRRRIGGRSLQVPHAGGGRQTGPGRSQRPYSRV